MSLCATPRNIFGGVVVATTGNVEQGRKDFSDVDIQRYLKHWGGSFSFDLDDSVTHLVALPEEVNIIKKRPARVNSALKLKKTIVRLEWLEDSLMQARKLPITEYLLAKGGRAVAQTLRAKREKEQKKAAREDEIGKNYPHARRFHEYIDMPTRFLTDSATGLFRPYSDETFFRYEVTLTRGDKGERYQVTLFESNAQPHTYQVGRIYRKSKGAKQLYDRMAGPDAGVPFNAALKEFKAFFARKTGVQWDDRVGVFYKGKGKVASDDFVYELPTRGKPIGLVKGKVPDLDMLTGPDISVDEAASDHVEEVKEEEDQQENPADATEEEAVCHDGNDDDCDEKEQVCVADDRAMDDIDDTSNGGASIGTITLPIISAVADDANDSGVEDEDVASSNVNGMEIGLDDEGYSSI
ncbi:hypothetical protein PG985_000804 [Apiospora marii]|uniref:uncharacterized protein n=1 Tax=Apiospora marii TaxID=335849 RepID=UPI00312DDAC4